MHTTGKENQMLSLRGKPLLRRRAVRSQQLQGRTCTSLHPGRPHLPSDVPRSDPSQTCLCICRHRGSSRQGAAPSSGPFPFVAALQPWPGWCPGRCCRCRFAMPCPTVTFCQGRRQPLLCLCQGHLGAKLHRTATARPALVVQTADLQVTALDPSPGHAGCLPQLSWKLCSPRE